MTKLFNKFLSTSVATLSVLCSFACSDKIAGTAEEPNQFAYGGNSNSNDTESNIGYISSSSNNEKIIEATSSSSSDSTPPPQIQPTSSSGRDSNPLPADMESSSSGNIGNSGSTHCYTQDGTKELCGPTDSILPTLEDYLYQNHITGVQFDESVIAYNKTYDSSQKTTEKANIAELRTVGLHKFTKENLTGLTYLFPQTMLKNSQVYSTDEDVYIGKNGCPLYVLNIKEMSPAVHVLTSISNETITIATFYDNCDYEPNPFETHVGFLFAHCGEFSASTEIINTPTLNESMTCGSVKYTEYIYRN